MAEGIRFAREGVLGRVTLDRPGALNALSHGMVRALAAQLALWAEDPDIGVVAIEGAGDRAFCAGGDIRALYDAGRVDPAANFGFYADEYRLNAQIARYPKPYVAVMDGIVMGGGVGVSIHGRRRIATPRTVFAMPETGIGLIPDVGGAHFLPRLGHRVGFWLGLTGSRLRGVETVQAGVCDLLVEDLGPVWAGLRAGVVPDPAPRGPLAGQERIAAGFAGGSVAEILAALDAMGDWGAAQAAAIRGKSPLCTVLAHRQLTLGAGLDLGACLAMEYRLARFCMVRPDFYEGVRAAILDRDGAPRWSPGSLEAVTPDLVAAAFAPLGALDLVV